MLTKWDKGERPQRSETWRTLKENPRKCPRPECDENLSKHLLMESKETLNDCHCRVFLVLSNLRFFISLLFECKQTCPLTGQNGCRTEILPRRSGSGRKGKVKTTLRRKNPANIVTMNTDTSVKNFPCPIRRRFKWSSENSGGSIVSVLFDWF